MVWNKINEDRLKSLWDDGLSCSQIAKAIGDPRISRNSVIGKANRMGLPKRVAQPTRRKKFLPKLKELPKLPENIPEVIAEPVNLETVSHSNFCHFPMWADRERPTLMYCGGKPDGGTQYCSRHLAKMRSKAA